MQSGLTLASQCVYLIGQLENKSTPQSKNRPSVPQDNCNREWRPLRPNLGQNGSSLSLFTSKPLCLPSWLKLVHPHINCPGLYTKYHISPEFARLATPTLASQRRPKTWSACRLHQSFPPTVVRRVRPPLDLKVGSHQRKGSCRNMRTDCWTAHMTHKRIESICQAPLNHCRQDTAHFLDMVTAFACKLCMLV